MTMIKPTSKSLALLALATVAMSNNPSNYFAMASNNNIDYYFANKSSSSDGNVNVDCYSFEVTEDESSQYYDYFVNSNNSGGASDDCSASNPCAGDLFVANYPIFSSSNNDDDNASSASASQQPTTTQQQVGTHIQTATMVPNQQGIFTSVFDFNDGNDNNSYNTIQTMGNMGVVEAIIGGTGIFLGATGEVEYYDTQSTDNTVIHHAKFDFCIPSSTKK